MSAKVEVELLRRLDVMTKERDEALADIETLKLHVETLREAFANLIEAAERYYDATFDLNEAEKHQRDVDRSADANPHDIAHAQCKLWSQKAETLRAAGALLRAVEAYREADSALTTDETEE